MPADLMTALGTLLGFVFLGDLDIDEQNSLGNFLMLIGQVLSTNATQLQLLQDRAQASTVSKMQRDIADLQAQLAALTTPHSTSSTSSSS